MLWLMIGLLVSLAALLFAAGAGARHILIRRAQLRAKSLGYTDPNLDFAAKPEETDVEP